MDNKQLTDLIKRVSTDQKLQLTEDTSLLSEERYPFELSPLFESLTKPTSLCTIGWSHSSYLYGVLRNAKVQRWTRHNQHVSDNWSPSKSPTLKSWLSRQSTLRLQLISLMQEHMILTTWGLCWQFTLLASTLCTVPKRARASCDAYAPGQRTSRLTFQRSPNRRAKAKSKESQVPQHMLSGHMAARKDHGTHLNSTYKS